MRIIFMAMMLLLAGCFWSHNIKYKENQKISVFEMSQQMEYYKSQLGRDSIYDFYWYGMIGREYLLLEKLDSAYHFLKKSDSTFIADVFRLSSLDVLKLKDNGSFDEHFELRAELFESMVRLRLPIDYDSLFFSMTNLYTYKKGRMNVMTVVPLLRIAAINVRAHQCDESWKAKFKSESDSTMMKLQMEETSYFSVPEYLLILFETYGDPKILKRADEQIAFAKLESTKYRYANLKSSIMNSGQATLSQNFRSNWFQALQTKCYNGIRKGIGCYEQLNNCSH